MELKGHIKDHKGETLCGSSQPVKETGLYGKVCGNCAEEASFLLRGGKHKNLRKHLDLTRPAV